ncbi:MAG: HTH-type transcriptional repressor RspR [Enterocloster aldenensis]
MAGISGNFTTQVYNGLIEEIIEGSLKGGDRLCDTDIAQRYGVSRTPVREAILLLEKDGFVETIGRKGVFIKTMSIQSVKDIYFVREILEGTAGNLATQLVQDDDLLLISNILTKMEDIPKTGRYSDYTKLDQEFHSSIVNICGVGLLNRLCTQMSLQGASILLKGKDYEKNIEQYNREHRLIFERLQARDAAGTEQAIREHIQKGKVGVLLQMLNNT